MKASLRDNYVIKRIIYHRVIVLSLIKRSVSLRDTTYRIRFIKDKKQKAKAAITTIEKSNWIFII